MAAQNLVERVAKSQMDRLVPLLNNMGIEAASGTTKITVERLKQIQSYNGYATFNEVSQFCKGTGVSSSYILDGRFPITG